MKSTNKKEQLFIGLPGIPRMGSYKDCDNLRQPQGQQIPVNSTKKVLQLISRQNLSSKVELKKNYSDPRNIKREY